MSDATVAPAGRPRRRWLAALLNVLLLPAGYAYLGAWKWVGGVLIVAAIFGVVLVELTVAFPPGIYAFDTGGLYIAAIALAAGFGAHAAWIASRSAPKTGSRMIHAATYLGVWLLLLGVAQGLRAFWPHAFYVTSSASMDPSLQQGDIIAVRGARAACGNIALSPGRTALYRLPDRPLHYIHRAVAGPGQSVAVEAGRLSIDGKFVPHRQAGRFRSGQMEGAVFEETLAGRTYRVLDLMPDGDLDNFRARVPAGHWFFLGDNRDNAADSRVTGPVRAADICAVGIKIVQSKDKSRVGQSL